MKKIFLMKIMAFLLIGTMLLSLVSCGKNSNSGELENVVIPENNEMVYEGKDILLAGVQGVVDSFEIEGDILYFTTYIFEEDKNADKEEEKGAGGTAVTGFYKARTNGSCVQEIKKIEWDEDKYLVSWTSDGENILYVMGNNEGKKGTYNVCKINNEGNLIFEENITETANLNPTDDRTVSIEVHKQGEIILAARSGAYIFDEKARYIDKVKLEGNANGEVAKTKDGEIVCSSNDSGKNIVLLLDVDNKKWNKQFQVETISTKDSVVLMNGLEYDFYYSDDSGIFGYDMEKEKAVKLVDYILSDMGAIDVNGICPMDKNKLIGLDTNSTNNSLTVYNKVDANEVIEKQTVVLGGLWLAEDLKEEVIQFNKTNKKYRIELKDYNDPEVDQVTKLTMDIMTGNAPDILYLDFVPIEMYASKGVLEDLTPYYEKDSELSTDDIIPSVLETMKTGDELCYVSSFFYVRTVIGKTEDVGTEMGWTMEEMAAVLEKKGDGIEPFKWESKESRLRSLTHGFADFVDWETGECKFDSDEFKKILEYANNGLEEEETLLANQGIYPLSSAVRGGKVLLVEGVEDIQTIPLYREMMGGDITYIGYPCGDKQGSYFGFYNPLGIYSKSEVKEGAWEFLRMHMSKEYQDHPKSVYALPTRTDSFNELLEEVVKPDAFSDEFGARDIRCEDYLMEGKPLTQEEADAFRELVNRTNKRSQAGTPIEQIVNEEAQAYFMGDKSVDETAEIIQNRVTTYVNENR